MLDAYRDLIDELLGTPTEIRGLVESGETASAPRVRRLIAELRDRDRAVLERVQAMTRGENVYLRPLRLEAPAGDDEELTALLEGFERARGDLVSTLINLSLRDWEREAIHETLGEVTLVDEIEEHVEFDEERRRQIRELLAGG